MMLFQRLAFLEEPEGATLQFVRSELDRAASDSTMRIACLYTLGAAIGHLGEHDDAVRPYEALLVRELADDRPGAIRALGNAGFTRHVTRIIVRKADPREEIRAAVASALRKTPMSDATTALLGLTSDSAIVVQRTAYQSLADHPLTGSTFRELHAESCARDNLDTLVNVVARYGYGPRDGKGLGLKYGIGAGVFVVWGTAAVFRVEVAYSPDARTANPNFPLGIYAADGQMF